MLRLLYIEWLKLKNYRTFWILSSLYVISMFGINYIVYRIQEEIYRENQSKGVVEMLVGSRPYEFPTVWQMASYVSSFLLFLPGLFLIILITNEYSYKTHRQNIIDGWSRSQFISVKIALAVISSIFSTLIVFLVALGFGLVGKEPFSADKFYFLGYFFLQALSYGMVALLFALLFKRGGLAIGVFFLYSIVLENMIAGLMNHYMNYSGRYLPLESTDALIPLPVFQQMQKSLIPTPNFTALFIVALVYLVIYYILANRKFKTDDL